jgi:hypothetical protein
MRLQKAEKTIRRRDKFRSMIRRVGADLFVVPDQVLNVFSGSSDVGTSVFGFENLGLKPALVGVTKIDRNLHGVA